MSNLEKVEALYKEKSKFLGKANFCHAMSIALVAALITWFGAFVAVAMDKKEVSYALMAGGGLVLLIPLAIYYYNDYMVWAEKAAKAEAILHLTPR